MTIRLHTCAAGPNGCYSPGVVDVPDALALELIRGGYAEEIARREPETAVRPTAPENAALPRPKRK